MSGQKELSFKATEAQCRPAVKRAANTAMRILMLGDFGGRSNRNGTDNYKSAADWSIKQVDIDNFAAVMSHIAPKLQLQMGNDTSPAVSIIFRQMEDFHPDTLFQKLEIFQSLSQIKDRLRNPATFAEAAEESRNSIQISSTAPAQEQTYAAVKAKTENDTATFDRLLGPRSRDREESSRISDETVTANYIKNIVAEYIIPGAPPFKDIYIKAVDDTIGAKMRELLHHPDFQALEAAWRSLYMLVTGLETGENLSLHLLDITKEELFAALGESGETLQSSKLYHLLVEQSVDTLGGEFWSVLVGNYTFGSSTEDVSLLALLGILASHAGGPFLASADTRLLGCRSLADSPDPHDWLGME
jgi:type VI secretion system protein ImpC